MIKEVGPKFTEAMDSYRQWHFGFPDTYDVIIWDRLPGEPYAQLYNVVQQVMCPLR